MPRSTAASAPLIVRPFTVHMRTLDQPRIERYLRAEQTGADHIAFPQDFRSAMDRDPSVGAILTGQRKIFEARRQVMQAEVGITNEKIAQVRQEIVGLGAQKAALTDRAAISQQELDQVTALNAKGLERKNTVLNLQREKADLAGQQGQVEAIANAVALPTSGAHHQVALLVLQAIVAARSS